MLRDARLRPIQAVVEQLELGLVISALDFAFESRDHQLDALDAVVEIGHCGGRGEVFDDILVAPLFGGDMGGDLTEEVVHGVRQKLKPVMQVGELSLRGGESGWVGILGLGASVLVRLRRRSFLLYLLLLLGLGRRCATRRGGGEFEDFERICRFGRSSCYTEVVVWRKRDLIAAEAGLIVDEDLKASSWARL